ncbi:unnamed protein product [Prorocentrum cordatum]|uniref:Uncharacterized protein n=1 Tax=Prorocentrum cordatum TaxID=2364126 RepID=A0ABN9USW8_9DINO|nr:unnamed protein product [Polarella glacialis]
MALGSKTRCPEASCRRQAGGLGIDRASECGLARFAVGALQTGPRSKAEGIDSGKAGGRDSTPGAAPRGVRREVLEAQGRIRADWYVRLEATGRAGGAGAPSEAPGNGRTTLRGTAALSGMPSQVPSCPSTARTLPGGPGPALGGPGPGLPGPSAGPALPGAGMPGPPLPGMPIMGPGPAPSNTGGPGARGRAGPRSQLPAWALGAP